MWTVKRSNFEELYTVGTDDGGKWNPRSDWNSEKDAYAEADRLNGVLTLEPVVSEAAQHVYNHYDKQPRINVTVEKNSRGFNYGVTVTDATSVSEALAMLYEALGELRAQFGAEE